MSQRHKRRDGEGERRTDGEKSGEWNIEWNTVWNTEWNTVEHGEEEVVVPVGEGVVVNGWMVGWRESRISLRRHVRERE